MYRDEKRSWMKHLDFTILDMLMMELALILAYGWRFEHAWLFNHELYVRIAVIALLIDVCVVFFFRGIHGYPAAKQVSGITLDCDALRRGLGRCSGIYVCDKDLCGVFQTDALCLFGTLYHPVLF